MSLDFVHKRWFPFVVLSLVIFLGALLRLNELSVSTMGHAEIYIPGIDLPTAEYSDPPARTQFLDSITKPIADEVHPPGYYMFMFAWTKLFGTGIVAIRFPSAIFGIGSILLIYFLADLERDRWVAISAAVMLALHGLLIYWSQIARMYSMSCFLGLLSTWFLILALKGHRYSRLFQYFYVLVTLGGLITVFYFWFLFLVQILWVSLQAIAKKAELPGIQRIQFLVLILASPLISIAIFQSRRPSYLDPNVFSNLIQFLQFGFLFEKNYSASSSSAITFAASVLLFLLAIYLLISGLRSNLRGKVDQWDFGRNKGPSSIILISAGLLCFLLIMGFAYWTYGVAPSQTPLVLISSLVPLLVPVIDILLRRYWTGINSIAANIGEKMPLFDGRITLISLQAIVPIVGFVIISPAILLISSRTTLLFTPYLLIVLSIGLVSLIRKNRIGFILVPVLIMAFSLSVVHHKNNDFEHPTDYKSLVERWKPNIEETDIIFIQRHWVTTPIFYYLNFDKYNYVAGDYKRSINQNPNTRIWVLSFEGLPDSPEIMNALQDYEENGAIEALRVQSRLFLKSSSSD